MTLSTKGLAWAIALLWGGSLLLVGIVNLLFPSYGVAFLEWSGSLYPGYEGPGGFGSVVVVTLYGLVDGAIAGWLLAWLYNVFAAGPREAASPVA